MPRLLRCAQGHEWEPSTGSPVSPVCGQLEQTATATGRHTDEQSSGDAQRPPQLTGHQALIHRDIKPSNLMLSRDWRESADSPRAIRLLKILDMGVARLHQLQHEDTITTLTQHGAVIGTPDYIAPEQVENPHLADSRS